jgi:hypothetical protein
VIQRIGEAFHVTVQTTQPATPRTATAQPSRGRGRGSSSSSTSGSSRTGGNQQQQKQPRYGDGGNQRDGSGRLRHVASTSSSSNDTHHRFPTSKDSSNQPRPSSSRSHDDDLRALLISSTSLSEWPVSLIEMVCQYLMSKVRLYLMTRTHTCLKRMRGGPSDKFWLLSITLSPFHAGMMM